MQGAEESDPSEEAIDEAQDDWSGGFPVELRVELSESASVGASLQLAGENEPFRPDLAGLAREYIWRMILLLLLLLLLLLTADCLSSFTDPSACCSSLFSGRIAPA